MRSRARLLAAATAATLVAGTALVWSLTGTASAAAGQPLPAHVFAPYFEAYNGDSLSGLSSQSGARYLTLAFVQTPSRGSCTVYWDGDTGTPIGSTFASDISAIRNAGGDVIPSFGGYAADNGGTEIADSCTNVNSIAAQFENVVTTYNVTRIDLDVEDNSLTNSAGIDRRNKAIKMVEDWAAANGRTVQFSYTLPTTRNGLASSGLAVLQNAVSNNARVDVVNIMTFDYYDGGTHEMADDTKTAATGLHSQLASLYPGKSSSQLWNMIGVTEMIGVDDYGPAETFTTADAPVVEAWAASQGLALLSFWALQRDNGGCPGGAAADNCSGVSQSTWQFSHAFEPFTSGATSPSPTASGSRSASPSASPSRSVSASPSRSTSPSASPSSPPPGTSVVNGDFEFSTLSPWSCTGNLGSVVTSPVHGGTHALKAAASNSDDAQCSQNLSLLANHTYTLSAWVQGNYAFLGTSNAATNNSTWTSSSAWTKLSVQFTTGATGAVQIWVHGWYAQGPIYADDVTIA